MEDSSDLMLSGVCCAGDQHDVHSWVDDGHCCGALWSSSQVQQNVTNHDDNDDASDNDDDYG